MDCNGQCEMRLLQLHPRSKAPIKGGTASDSIEDSSSAREPKESFDAAGTRGDPPMKTEPIKATTQDRLATWEEIRRATSSTPDRVLELC